MADIMIELRTRVAWWVRPALAVAFVVAWLAERWIDVIVDNGIKVEQDSV